MELLVLLDTSVLHKVDEPVGPHSDRPKSIQNQHNPLKTSSEVLGRKECPPSLMPPQTSKWPSSVLPTCCQVEVIDKNKDAVLLGEIVHHQSRPPLTLCNIRIQTKNHMLTCFQECFRCCSKLSWDGFSTQGMTISLFNLTTCVPSWMILWPPSAFPKCPVPPPSKCPASCCLPLRKRKHPTCSLLFSELLSQDPLLPPRHLENNFQPQASIQTHRITASLCTANPGKTAFGHIL